MSQSKELEIPKSVLKLPIVKTAEIYSKNGNLIDIEVFEAGSSSTQGYQYVPLVRDTEQLEPLQISHLDKSKFEDMRRQAYVESHLRSINARMCTINANVWGETTILAGILSLGTATFTVQNAITAQSATLQQSQQVPQAGIQSATDLTTVMGGALSIGFAIACAYCTKKLLGALEEKKDGLIKAKFAQLNLQACDRELVDISNRENEGMEKLYPTILRESSPS